MESAEKTSLGCYAEGTCLDASIQNALRLYCPALDALPAKRVCSSPRV